MLAHIPKELRNTSKTNAKTRKGYGISHEKRKTSTISDRKAGITLVHILELYFPVRIALLIKIGQFREREKWFNTDQKVTHSQYRFIYFCL